MHRNDKPTVQFSSQLLLKRAVLVAISFAATAGVRFALWRTAPAVSTVPDAEPADSCIGVASSVATIGFEISAVLGTPSANLHRKRCASFDHAGTVSAVLVAKLLPCCV